MNPSTKQMGVKLRFAFSYLVCFPANWYSWFVFVARD